MLFTQPELQFEPFTFGKALASGVPHHKGGEDDKCAHASPGRVDGHARECAARSFHRPSLPRLDGAARSGPNFRQGPFIEALGRQAITNIDRHDSMASGPGGPLHAICHPPIWRTPRKRKCRLAAAAGALGSRVRGNDRLRLMSGWRDGFYARAPLDRWDRDRGASCPPPSRSKSLKSTFAPPCANIGRQARAAARELANAPAETKNRALHAAARLLRGARRRDSGRQRARSRRGQSEGPEPGLDRPAGARCHAHRGDGARASRRSPPCPTRSGACSRPSRAPTASSSSGSRRRSASSASSTRAGPTSPPTPARSASRAATPWCCAAGRTASIRRRPSMPASSRA